MTARTFALATALVLGLTGLARAQAASTWQEPGSARGAEAPMRQAQAEAPRDAAAPPSRSQAEPQARRHDAQAAPRRAQASRGEPERQAAPERRRRDYRSARYRGGAGATWKTGRDAYGFMGSYGGCSYRGNAGPNGYRLDRRC